MEAFYYIYTATAANDYCSLVFPDSSFFNNEEIERHFTKRIRNLINIDAYGEHILNSPIRLLIKEAGIVLWGVGCNTSELAHKTDDAGRGLHIFVGLFMKDQKASDLKLPYDLDFFKRVFEDIVLPQWDRYTSGLCNIQCTSLEAKEFIRPNPSALALNTDYHYCRIFNAESSEEKQFFEQALGYDGDISVASKIVDLRQATSCDAELLPLMNVLYPLSGEQYKDVLVEYECKQCGRQVHDMQDGICLTCWQERHKTPPLPVKKQCKQCGKECDSVLSDGLCEACHDKRIDSVWKRRLTNIISVVIVAGLILLAVPYIRSCKNMEIGQGERQCSHESIKELSINEQKVNRMGVDGCEEKNTNNPERADKL